MYKKGEVDYYDGFSGNIKGSDGIDYILLKNQIVKLKNSTDDYNNIKEGDLVKFIPEIYESPEVIEFIARFVQKEPQYPQITKKN